MKRFTHIGNEDGWVLVTSMAVLFIILTLGIVTLRNVDAQTHQSGRESAAEAAFNMAESALDAETLRLQTGWPTAATWWSGSCTNQTAAATASCPGPSLTSSFNATYAGSEYLNPTWQLQVFDDSWNPDNDYYSDSLAQSAPTYDANADNKVWVRAQVTVAGQTRVVAAEAVRQSQVVSLPRNVVTAGGMYTSNNGNKVIVDATDSVSGSGLTGNVALRCGTASPPTTVVYGSLCAGWNASKGQLSPPNYNTGYVDPTGGGQPLQPAQLAALQQTAVSKGTYYNGSCPPAGTAGVVYVDNPPGGGCSYTSNTTWNSNSAPGMLIFAHGTVSFSGTLNFYGIVYMADEEGPAGPPCSTTLLQQDEADNNNGPVFTVHGNGTLYGALFVGNCGVVDAGSSAFNIQFDSQAFNGAVAYSSAALAKNTFQLVAHP